MSADIKVIGMFDEDFGVFLDHTSMKSESSGTDMSKVLRDVQKFCKICPRCNDTCSGAKRVTHFGHVLQKTKGQSERAIPFSDCKVVGEEFTVK